MVDIDLFDFIPEQLNALDLTRRREELKSIAVVVLPQQFDVPIGFRIFHIVVFIGDFIGIDGRVFETQVDNVRTISGGNGKVGEKNREFMKQIFMVVKRCDGERETLFPTTNRGVISRSRTTT